MATVNRPNAPQDYCTPPELIEAVVRRFGPITFDAACTAENAVAPLGYCYPEVDALTEDWGQLISLQAHVEPQPVVWCNPPFKLSRLFAAKAAQSQERKDGQPRVYAPLVLLLVPAAVDSRWFMSYVYGKALVLPLSPRVQFIGQPAAINRPLMLCAYGLNITPAFEPWQWADKKPRRKTT